MKPYDAVAHGARCSVCPLRGRHQPVGPSGPPAKRAALTLFGEGPGWQEVELGIPFVGDSGDYIIRDPERSVLGELGMHPARVHINNAMSCRAPEKDYGTFLAKLNARHKRACDAARKRGERLPPRPVYPHVACRPRALRELQGSRVVLALGAWAAWCLLGADKITPIAGYPFKVELRPDGTCVRAWGLGGHEALVDGASGGRVLR